MKKPKALAEIACTLSRHGTEVLIQCDEADDAYELFEWLEGQVGP